MVVYKKNRSQIVGRRARGEMGKTKTGEGSAENRGKTTGKDKIGTAIAVFAIVAGVAVLCYPFVSNYLFAKKVGSTVHFQESSPDAAENTAEDEEKAVFYAGQRQEAEAYNALLAEGEQSLLEPFGTQKAGQEKENGAGGLSYWELLEEGDGLMCHVEIPSIEAYLPVYHGTAPDTLEKGVGHLEGSSLPVGGESTHCVLSGHTGLNKAKLFTDLTMLENGDVFYLHTAGETLAYRTDRIKVVEPEDVSDLKIVQGEDYVTLVTCTPYGINSHRLLVRGSRVPYTEKEHEQMEAKADGMPRSRWMEEYRMALYGTAGLGVLFLLWMTVRHRKKKQREKAGE